MSANVTVILGPARAGKTYAILGQYRCALAEMAAGQVDGVLWLAPSARAAGAVRDQLLASGLSACLSPGVTTFNDLAKAIVAASPFRLRPISGVAERELMRRAIAAALDGGRIEYYAASARRPGFVDLAIGHVRELKRCDIRPEAYTRLAAERGQLARHRELALLYDAYETALAVHQLIDAEGMHRAARETLASGACSRFGDLRMVVVDGFTDFTRTQLATLQALAERTAQLIISLPSDGVIGAAEVASTRLELFAKPAATLAELHRVFPNLQEQQIARRPTEAAALAHVVDHIFRHPQPMPSNSVCDSLDAIEFVAAASEHDELAQIARRIKRLLQPAPGASKTRPSDILVVFRALGDGSTRIDEVFPQFEFPYTLESAARLETAPVFRTLQSLLRLDIEDWQFRRVVSVVTNGMLTAIEPKTRAAADWLVRDVQIAQGREKLLRFVGEHSSMPAESETRSEHYQRRVRAARTALPALRALADAFDQLPEQATANEWFAALTALLATLGVRTTDAVSSGVWSSIEKQLAALTRLDETLGQPVRQLTRRDLLAVLADIGKHEPLPRRHDEVGHVRILAAPSARSVSARHVFLAGMSEQAFPLAGGSGKLVDDGEYARLTQAAHAKRGRAKTLDPPAAATRSQDEMLLFYEVISRAEETLTISYPAMDDKAQELPPSPYVTEIERMFRDSETKIRRTGPHLSPVPRSAGGPFTLNEWRLQAVADGLQTESNAKLLAGLFAHADTREVAAGIDAGLRITHARARGEAFGPSEGMLTSGAAAAELAKRFGKKHSWSASSFETYAACPYKFFLHNVLRLEPLGDLTLETDFASRGSLLHRVLAAFHRKFSETPGEWAAIAGDRTRFDAELKQALTEAMDGSPVEGLEAALLELDRRQVDRWTGQYPDQHKKYDDAWENFDQPLAPTHFELRFGRKHADETTAEDESSTDKVFTVDIGDEKILVSGRIDRIDVGRKDGQTVFNVIDYKSGRRPTLSVEKIKSGERMQPALYLMAAHALVFDKDSATPLWAGYWAMNGGVTTKERYSLHCSAEKTKPGEGWEDLQASVIQRIGEIVHAARRGDFPVASTDADCTRLCDFRTVCRVAQVRSVGKAAAGEPGATGEVSGGA